MEEPQFLTSANGAKVIDFSSYSQGCSPSNILNATDRQLWLSATGTPQFVTVDLSNLRTRPATFTSFGWRCWHTYSSNPAVVELEASKDGTSFRKWAAFKADWVRGTQCFPIPPLSSEYTAIRVLVKDTFGAARTYINQVFLSEDKTAPAEDCADYKAQLQSQLEDLQKTINALKPADFPQLKREATLSAMRNSVSHLAQSVSRLECSLTGLSRKQSLSSFKASVLQELSPRCEFSEEWGLHMKSWQDQVLSPLFRHMSERVLSRVSQGPSVGDLLAQLQLKLTEKVQKLKQLEEGRRRRTWLLPRSNVPCK